MKKLNVAIQGCAHGQLQHIYESLIKLENKPDILLILGDFQSLLTKYDFKTCAIPPKYAKLGDFHKYYTGQLEAPVLTVFIGGNHENMGQLTKMPHGGYVAKNIFYMGNCNIINFMGVRIAGISGIYNEFDHLHEKPDWHQINWNNEKRSTYHIRDSELVPLAMIKEPISLVMSHDWPTNIARHGNLKKLLKLKPYFKDEINNNTLGSPLSWYLLKRLKPIWWTSAHLHVRYEAEYKHDQKINTDEIELDLDIDLQSLDGNTESAVKFPKEVSDTKTKFIALDKCKGGDTHRHLTEITIEYDEKHPTCQDRALYWDAEFLANLKYCLSNKHSLTGKNLQEIKVDELRANVEVTPEVDWSEYRIPVPSSYRSVLKQTEYVTEKYLK
ncbi:unnamed protein product [Kluyveromyces dobzhanskii CBS 2104]|uniref:WGS project CCBQ000000000 data, contig 00099 n=1 Tax=Kluyveromyces dobzhanskii CBS 2104 TaxID=1427455 RepID=A0A0A8L1M5_9SACH|nr:unnamed protein product [Kluyveromyces dobzhanskii CBS 2104]